MDGCCKWEGKVRREEIRIREGRSHGENERAEFESHFPQLADSRHDLVGLTIVFDSWWPAGDDRQDVAEGGSNLRPPF